MACQKLLEQIEQLKLLEKAEDVVRLLVEMFARFGVATVLVNKDVSGGPRGIFAQTGLPKELSALLAARNYLQFSPVGRMARQSFVPILWSKETWIGEPDPLAREVMQVVARFGFHEGCVIPVRGPNGFEADISLAGDQLAIPQDCVPLVHGLAHYAFVQLRQLHDRPPLPRRQLTRRGRDVLTLYARGKSTAEIAEAIGISERTVEEHVRNACRRMRVSNRTELVAIAVRDCLIQI